MRLTCPASWVQREPNLSAICSQTSSKGRPSFAQVRRYPALESRNDAHRMTECRCISLVPCLLILYLTLPNVARRACRGLLEARRGVDMSRVRGVMLRIFGGIKGGRGNSRGKPKGLFACLTTLLLSSDLDAESCTSTDLHRIGGGRSW